LNFDCRLNPASDRACAVQDIDSPSEDNVAEKYHLQEKAFSVNQALKTCGMTVFSVKSARSLSE